MQTYHPAISPDDFQRRLRLAVAAREASPNHIMSLIADELARSVDIGLVTITTVDPHDQSYARLFSSMPDVYPVSGRKPANRTRWSETVMEEKKSFVANDKTALAEVMSDHELISSLGFESILNVPIVRDDRVIGTLNCLSVAQHFTEDIIMACEHMTIPTMLALIWAGSDQATPVVENLGD